MSDPVSTRMGDHLWTGKPFRYVTSQLGQLSLSSLWGKLSTNLPGWGEGGAVTSVGWQMTLCDPTDKWRPVVLRWIWRRTICSFTCQVSCLHLQQLLCYCANKILLTQRNKQTYKCLPKYSQPLLWWSTAKESLLGLSDQTSSCSLTVKAGAWLQKQRPRIRYEPL